MVAQKINKDSPHVSVRIKKETYEKVKKYAEEKGMRITTVIEFATNEYIK